MGYMVIILFLAPMVAVNGSPYTLEEIKKYGNKMDHVSDRYKNGFKLIYTAKYR